MGMTPIQFFESFVKGNSDDSEENPGCIRRAFNAAVAASHLADHYFNFNERHNPNLVAGFDFGTYVEDVSKKTGGAFRDIRSIANAYKHLYTDIDPKRAARSSVDSSGAIESVELIDDPDLAAISEEYDSSSPELRSFVTFSRTDGTTSEFLPVLQTVVDFWLGEIHRT